MKKLFYLTATLFTVFTLTSASMCSSDKDDAQDPYYKQIVSQGFTYTVEKTDNEVILTAKGNVTGQIVYTYTYVDGALAEMNVRLDIDCGDALVASLVENYYRNKYSQINNVEGLNVGTDGSLVYAEYTVPASELSKLKANEYAFANDIDGLYNYFQTNEAFKAAVASANGTQVQ
ncbi:MAG: hypothetical protein IKC96_03530 [Paludibacteraceae bacterium]|nr:hypothetical protein [Paludibacteraceae bacterium]